MVTVVLVTGNKQYLQDLPLEQVKEISATLQSNSNIVQQRIVKLEEEEKLCNICLERKKNIVFDPCGHVVCCEVCANNPHFNSICPKCRARITKKMKIYT